MSGQLTQFGANRAVQAGVGVAQAATAAMYLALATAEAASPDTATLATWAAGEIATAGYSRQEVAWGSPSGDPSQIANDAAIEFGPFTADPPEVTHCFLCDTSIGTTGNVMAYWALTAPRDAANGDTLTFGVGGLTISVD
jgi:hypothetical protein